MGSSKPAAPAAGPAGKIESFWKSSEGARADDGQSRVQVNRGCIRSLGRAAAPPAACAAAMQSGGRCGMRAPGGAASAAIYASIVPCLLGVVQYGARCAVLCCVKDSCCPGKERAGRRLGARSWLVRST